MSSAHSASTAPTVSTSLTIIFGKGPRKIILSSPVSGGTAAGAAAAGTATDGAAGTATARHAATAYRRVTFSRASADEPFAVERLTEKQAFHESVSSAQAEAMCAILLGEKPTSVSKFTDAGSSTSTGRFTDVGTPASADIPAWVVGNKGTFRQLNATSSTLAFEIRLAKRGKVMFSQRRRDDLAFLDAQRESGQGERYDGKPVPAACCCGEDQGGNAGNPSARGNAGNPGSHGNIGNAGNRGKEYLIKEGTDVAPLIDMGVFSPDGHVRKSMYDKYRQINRFLETVDDALKSWPKDTISVIDFGCGKFYLTFILYYYLTEVRHLKADVTGLDLKADVIAICNDSAKRHGYSGLHFEVADVEGYERTEPLDMVVSLHACDTATDFALADAVKWGARVIISVPCCQHELNGQIASDDLSILTRYGILKERTAAIMTDAIRANLLEACGYKTQILEFIDFEGTPKNLLIRAVKRDFEGEAQKAASARAREEVRALTAEFHLDPTLLRLLVTGGML